MKGSIACCEHFLLKNKIYLNNYAPAIYLREHYSYNGEA